MTERKRDDIQFVQCSHFGVTFGFRILNGILYLAASFAHKESPRTRDNYEQFSRAKGRAVTTKRLEAFMAGANGVPYTSQISVEDPSAGDVRKTIWTALETESFTVPAASIATYSQQIENLELFETVVAELVSELTPVTV